MSLPLFTIAHAGFNLYSTAEATGVVGWPDVAQALSKVALKMLAKAHKIDSDALDEMVSLARSRVPVDTGVLLNGITGEITDEGCEFRASAVHTSVKGKASADYAHFVEFGHNAGPATFANLITADDVFAGRASEFRRAKASRGSKTIAPQLFFYNSANEALEKRGLAMQDVIAQSAAEDGWQTE
jgi:hypothetical protein